MPTRLLLAAALIVMVLVGEGNCAQAQTPSGGWSTPELVARVANDGWIAKQLPPVPKVSSVEDGSGRVYAFWGQMGSSNDGADGPSAIYVSRRDPNGWTKPTDIVVSANRLCNAAAGPDGTLHLFWQGAGDRVYYARTTAGDATNVHAWTVPVPVDDSYPGAQLVVDSRGWVHRAYPGWGARGPYYQFSEDGGATWSPPANASRTSGTDVGADYVRLAVSENGTVHVVWTEFQLPTGWPPLGVYYSRSEDGGRTWSPAVQLAGYGYDQVNVAAAGNDTVHVAWNGMASIQGRYHRWSSDGGRTWSQTSTVLMGASGSEGPPQLAVDSSGTLHLLTSNGNRVWYASWRNGQWSQPAYVPSGDEAGVPPLGSDVPGSVRQIENVFMRITAGNRLGAMFWDIRRPQGWTYVWYTSMTTSAPATLAVVSPTPLPVPSRTASPVSSIAPSASWSTGLPAVPTRRPGAGPEDSLAPPDLAMLPAPENPRSTAFTGVWPSILLISGVLFFTATRRRGNG